MGFVWALVLCRLGQADTVVVFGLLLLPNRTEESAHSKKKTIEKGAGPKKRLWEEEMEIGSALFVSCF